MTLSVGTLQSGLEGAWSSYPETTQLAAERWGNAYDAYAQAAVACSMLGPTVVNKPGLVSGIKAALDSGGSVTQIAADIAAAHETYWSGAVFGATGAVAAIGGTSALAGALASLWPAQTASSASIAACAAAHAPLFDSFTKTVTVTDTAVPSPSGCGPAPIS